MSHRHPMVMHDDWTAERARALPDDGMRYEVLDGVLAVTPAPSFGHQRAGFILARVLDDYITLHRIGLVLTAPADVEFSPRRLLQPDVLVVPLVDGRPPRSFEEAGRLLLAAEVLSPTTARRDRFTKRAIYADEAVPEYWIVDTDARAIERWRPGDERPELIDDVVHWQPAPEVPPLELDVRALFDRALGPA